MTRESENNVLILLNQVTYHLPKVWAMMNVPTLMKSRPDVQLGLQRGLKRRINHVCDEGADREDAWQGGY